MFVAGDDYQISKAGVEGILGIDKNSLRESGQQDTNGIYVIATVIKLRGCTATSLAVALTKDVAALLRP